MYCGTIIMVAVKILSANCTMNSYLFYFKHIYDIRYGKTCHDLYAIVSKKIKGNKNNSFQLQSNLVSVYFISKVDYFWDFGALDPSHREVTKYIFYKYAFHRTIRSMFLLRRSAPRQISIRTHLHSLNNNLLLNTSL